MEHIRRGEENTEDKVTLKKEKRTKRREKRKKETVDRLYELYINKSFRVDAH